jgi:SAM-dependent methyltransferase
MHKSAMKNGELFFKTYAKNMENPIIVDIGAMDVNGSLRSVCPDNAKYIGVDLCAGKGVDIVISDPYKLPFSNEYADIVVSSSCFEHTEFFWVSFLEIIRILKPNGILYLNVPMNGDFHRYPVDCWRFYPDAGRALVNWAKRNGINTVLLESFVAQQDGAPWNDFVCVILKGSSISDNQKDRIIHTKKDFINGACDTSVDSMINFQEESEDRKQYLKSESELEEWSSPRLIRFAEKINRVLRKSRNKIFKNNKDQSILNK